MSSYFGLPEYEVKSALSPKWNITRPVHNWENYASDDLKSIWGSFTDEQKVAIYRSLQNVADSEEWD